MVIFKSAPGKAKENLGAAILSSGTYLTVQALGMSSVVAL